MTMDRGGAEKRLGSTSFVDGCHRARTGAMIGETGRSGSVLNPTKVTKLNVGQTWVQPSNALSNTSWSFSGESG